MTVPLILTCSTPFNPCTKKPEPQATPRLPRLTRLLALAHRLDEQVRSGLIANYADLATLGHVTRARISQIMNLLNLCPTIQEEILLHEPTDPSRPLTLHDVQPIAMIPNWKKQLRLWRTLQRTRVPQRRVAK